MTARDIHTLRAEALPTLAEATRAANGAPDVESARGHLTGATREVLGDKEAHLRPGGLRAGECQFVVSGIFLITADRQHNLLVAEHGVPPEQHHLRIPLDLWAIRGGWCSTSAPWFSRTLTRPRSSDRFSRRLAWARRSSGRCFGGARCSGS